MFVFKLSWLPYMLIIAGIILLADGDEAGIMLAIIGAGWLFSKSRAKKTPASGQSAGTQETPVQTAEAVPSPDTAAQNAPSPEKAPAPAAAFQEEPPKPVPPVQNTPVQSEQSAVPAPKFCPYCGVKLEPGSKFCPSCGKKL